MSERIIAIGDIHGCRPALETLLEAVDPGAEDTVITLGDYVDRGPDSKGVVDLLLKLEQQTRHIGIMGNHEEMMLSVIREQIPHHDWLRFGGLETLDSYGFDGDLAFLPPEHLAFFESLKSIHEADDYFFTHAAYDPQRPLTDQSGQMLRWHSLHESVPNPHPNGKTAVVGHTANREGEVLDFGHLICLDTHCYGGKWLTAMDLGSRQVWQSTPEGRLR